MDKAERNGGGNGWRPESLPVWVRAMALVGIPGVIAFFLIYVGASDMPKISRTVEHNQVKIDYLLKVVEERERDHASRDEKMYRLMMQLCVQQAKRTNTDLQQCFD